MPYIVKKISTQKINKQLYFIDANVWIYVLNNFNTKDKYKKEYCKFIENMLESELSPKIIMCNMLLSEIINTYSRQIAFPNFTAKNPAKTNFKQDFRNTSDYEKEISSLLDDLKLYQPLMEFVDDNFRAITNNKGIDYAQNMPKQSDYNDHFYIQLCLNLKTTTKQPLSIVTNDKDFKVQNIEVITNQKDLLKLSKLLK